MEIFISLIGIIVLLGIAFLLSAQRKAVQPRVILSALFIQIAFGAFVFYVPAGQEA